MTTQHKNKHFAALLTSMVVFAGCDRALGEPIVKFRGSVTTQVDDAKVPTSTEVAILWLTCADRKRGRCYFSGGSAGGGILVPEENPDQGGQIGACIAACDTMPECSDYIEWKSESGLQYCPEYPPCIDACGARAVWQAGYLPSLIAGTLSQPAAIEGEFPSSFELGVYEEPDDDAQQWSASSLPPGG